MLKSKGFTLIELMVTMGILGFIILLVGLLVGLSIFLFVV